MPLICFDIDDRSDFIEGSEGFFGGVVEFAYKNTGDCAPPFPLFGACCVGGEYHTDEPALVYADIFYTPSLVVAQRGTALILCFSFLGLGIDVKDLLFEPSTKFNVEGTLSSTSTNTFFFSFE